MSGAKVFQHPAPAAAPVIQAKRGPGRLPKDVVKLEPSPYRRYCRELEQKDKDLIAKECLRLDATKAHLLQTIQLVEEQICELTAPGLTREERSVLADEIRWEHTPWQEKQSILAARAARSTTEKPSH